MPDPSSSRSNRATGPALRLQKPLSVELSEVEMRRCLYREVSLVPYRILVIPTALVSVTHPDSLTPSIGQI
jgi:hypothetical protein